MCDWKLARALTHSLTFTHTTHIHSRTFLIATDLLYTNAFDLKLNQWWILGHQQSSIHIECLESNAGNSDWTWKKRRYCSYNIGDINVNIGCRMVTKIEMFTLYTQNPHLHLFTFLLSFFMFSSHAQISNENQITNSLIIHSCDVLQVSCHLNNHSTWTLCVSLCCLLVHLNCCSIFIIILFHRLNLNEKLANKPPFRLPLYMINNVAKQWAHSSHYKSTK